MGQYKPKIKMRKLPNIKPYVIILLVYYDKPVSKSIVIFYTLIEFILRSIVIYMTGYINLNGYRLTYQQCQPH